MTILAPARKLRFVLALLVLYSGSALAQVPPAQPAEEQKPKPAETQAPDQPSAQPGQAADQTTSPDENSDNANRTAAPPPRDTVARKEPPSAFKTLVRNVIVDQKVMWLSPFHMNRGNAPAWIGFSLATGVLIATDRTTGRQLPNTNDQTKFSQWISQTGATYTLYPIAAAFYFGGVLAGSDKSKEVGALSGEALTDALIISSVLKAVTGRERPELPGGNGNWGVWGNYSFPSGHAIMSWALASVVAHEYHKTKIIPITAYSLATIVSAARFSARKHWASDIVAGGSMGWFIGRYVYREHADEVIHHAPLAKLMPDGVAPYVNANTASVGMGLVWNLGSR